jgi:Flp pilus assembly protein TadG
MNFRSPAFHAKGRRGGALIELVFITILLFMVIFTMVEMNRMLLVTAALADSARAGVRYAIVHGADNAVTATQIATVIQNFASTGILNPAQLNVANASWTPTYTACSGCRSNTQPGSTVQITVSYPYDPFITYFPGLQVTLSSTSDGVITY